MTPERYQALLEAQGGTCAICNKPPDARKSLAVDHCHRTGAIRALLCMRCNVVVGIYEIHSQAVAKYLADFGTGNPLLDQ